MTRPVLSARSLRALAFALASPCAAACADFGPPEDLTGGLEAPESRGSQKAQALISAAAHSPPERTAAGVRVSSIVDDETMAESSAPAAARPLHRGVVVDVHEDGSSFSIASRRDGFPVRLTRLGVEAGAPVLKRGSVSIDAGPTANAALVFAKDHAVEDLLVVRDLSVDLGYEVDLPERWRLDHDSRRVVELVDPLGTPRLRLVTKEAWDARGRAVRVGLRLEGARRVIVDIDASGAELPLYVDPEIQDTGTVAFARSRNNLILGLDARAYVIGGDPEEPLPVEVFDPRTGRFDVLGPELPARERSAAVVLRDGRIAVVGGRRKVAGEWQALDTLDLLDPRTGTISDSVELAQARSYHTVTRLADGRLLIVGGEQYEGDEITPLASTEIFDPEAGALSMGPALSEARSAATATLLEDSRVLVAGGGASSAAAAGIPLRSAELFDPTPNTWASTPGELVTSRWRHAATMLHDGRVLLWGGQSLYLSWVPAEVFDPALGTFSEQDWPLYYAPDQPPSQLMVDGDLFASGATVSPETGVDPATELWGHYEAPSTLLHDGRTLYVVGATAYLGLPSTPVVRHYSGWTSMPRRGDHAATLLPSGRVLLTGGHYAVATDEGILAIHEQLDSAEIDPVSGNIEVTAPLARARLFHTATLLANGQVLIVGGQSPSGADNRVSELYDPVTQTLSWGPAIQLDRVGHTATPLPGGDVLIVGGSEERLVERYAGSKGQFVEAGQLGAPRVGHTATLLSDGQVLIAGGGTPQLEIYDPATSTLSSAGTLLQERTGHGAALLPDGRVLFAGDNSFTRNEVLAEIWDPATGVSSALATPPDWPWIGMRDPALLWDGSVLFANGAIFRPGSEVIERAWPYQSFELTGRSVTRLLDGGVLVAGAYTGGDEIYDNTFTRLSLLPRVQPRAPELSSYPPEVASGSAHAIEGLRVPGLTEGSSSHTLASAVNHPVAVWVPLPEGTPVLGTMVDFTDQAATWRVPVTPFAGLGSLLVVSAGLKSGGAPVFVSRAPVGIPCDSSQECASGVCSGGICCDRACGPCEACTAAEKGEGIDGTCGPLATGSAPTSPSACPAEPLSTCGLTGVCDGLGRCATFDEGTPCLAGASCREGECAVDPPRCDGSDILEGGVTVKSCFPYACSEDLTCLEACRSNLDCADDVVCTPERTCEQRTEPTQMAPGCSVGASPPCSSWPAAGALVALALFGLARRRSRRSQLALSALALGLASCTARVIDDPPAQGGAGAAPAGGGGEGATGGAPVVQPAECGNGVREVGEACDGLDLGQAACADLGLGGGPPRCTYDCTLDPTSCAGCGNGYVDPGEECDGGPPPFETCLSQAPLDWVYYVDGLYKGNLDHYDLVTGTLGCNDDCTLDRGGCGYCFDGVINGEEVCDDLDGPYGDQYAPDFGGETCSSQSPDLSGDNLGCPYHCRWLFLGGCDRPPPPTCAVGDNCSLVLGGGSLNIPQDSAVGLTLSEGPLTIEYWARIDDPGTCPIGVGAASFNPSDLTSGTGYEWGLGQGYVYDTVVLVARGVSLEEPFQPAYAYSAVEEDTWFHVAGVLDTEEARLRLFVDGELVAEELFQPPAQSAPLQSIWMGSPCFGYDSNLSYRTWGRMDELRLSRGARYDGPFTPEPVFSPDGDTLALYHFDEGSGEVALDASGSGRHAIQSQAQGSEPLLWAGEHP
jgi:hypothetical protein